MADINAALEGTDWAALAKKSGGGAAVPAPSILDANPDLMARHKDMAEKSGLPIETVSRNEKTIASQQTIENTDWADVARRAPVLSKKLNSEYASLYADDIDNLAAQEGFLYEMGRAGSNIGKAARSAIPAFNEGVWGVAEAGAGVLSRGITGPLVDARVLPQDPFAVAEDFLGRQRRVSESVRKAWSPDPTELGAIESGVYSGVTSLAQQVPGIAASVLMGNPAPMLAFGAGVEGGQSFGAARDKGLNFWQSLNYGAGQAGIEALTESIPAGKLLSDVGMKTGFGRTLLNQLMAEVPGEQVATFLQDLNQQINLNPEKTMGDFLRERPGAALQTLVATLVATGGQVSVAKLTEKSLDGLGKLQQKSKLKARSDATMEEHISDIVKDGADSVYVDADTFTTYFQEQGINPEMAAKEILGDVTAYQQAMTSGQALKIPMAKYVTKIAPTKHNDFFAREVRREPDMMNGREADQFVSDFEGTLSAEDQKEVDQIQDDLVGKLRETGFSAADADTYALQMARFFNAQGDRYGANPLELHQRFIEDIIATETVPGGAMEQSLFPEGNRLSAMDRNSATWKAIKSENPAIADDSDTVTVYRSTVGDAIRPNDFVAINKDIAEQHLESLNDRGESGKIIEQQVKVSDLLMANDATEFVYSPDSPNILLQSAYHGSPYKFDKFTLDHIGSGEGAQAYGHGLYFAGNKEVAKYYQEALSARDDKGYASAHLNAKNLVKRFNGDAEWAAEIVKEQRDNLSKDEENYDRLDKTLKFIESGEYANNLPVAGQLYKVEIPDDSEYLLWDEPLGSQPENIRNAVYKSGYTSDADEMTGKEIYQDTADSLAGGPETENPNELASKLFNGLGVRGIKYKAGQLSGADSGSFNYVIFDENAIQIAETYYQNQQKPRGFMQIKPGRKLLIGLTSARDLSSFLHESGHAYLEIMRDVVADLKSRDVAGLTDSQKGIVADSDTLLKWLGVDSFDKIEREHHEKFARCTEAYFMEGKAPSIALRQAFARFRAWMMAIYKTARGLNVQLNDDVRAVFDRMFATDAEIEQARNEEQLIPVFTSAEQMGKTAREFELYMKDIQRANLDARERLEQKIISQWMRERERWWKEELANVRAEVEEELKQQKDYVNLSIMQTGKLPDGTEAMPVKLSTDAIKALYDDKTKRRQASKAVRKNLRKGKAVDPVRDDLKAMVAKWGGISRDEAKAQGIDPSAFNRRGWGILPMFPANGGMTFDALAEKMSEVGFFAGEDYTANAALDMVNDALRGDDIRTPEGHAHKADQDMLRAAEDEALKSENYKLEIQQMVIDKHPEIQADGVDRLIAERALEAVNAGVSTYTVDDILENDDLDAAIAALDKEIENAKLQYGEGEAVPASTAQGSDYDFGEIPFGEEAGFESGQEVDAFFGDEATQSVKVMRALRKHKVLDKGGVTPDEAAMLMGYASGARLVDMLVNLKPLKQAVSERADSLMKERHKDLLSDSAELADAAREMVLNEYQEDVLKKELQAINELNRKAAPFLKEKTRQQRDGRQAGLKTMRAMPSVELLKTIAARQIAQVKYRDLKPSVYLAAMRRDGKDAMKHIEDQNYQAAAFFKQRQMLNIELYRESMKVKEGLDKGVQFARKFTDKKVRQRLGKTDYLDQIDQILERFDFTNISLKSVDERKTLAAFIKEQGELGIPINLPIEITETVGKKSYKDMTAEELVGVVDGIRHLDQMSRNKDKLLKLADKMRFDELADMISKTITDNAKSKKRQRLEEGMPQDRAAQAIDGIFASHRKLSNILQVMDAQDGGVLFDSIVSPLNAAGDREAVMREESAIKLNDLFEPYTTIEKQLQAKLTGATAGIVELGLYKPEYIPEIGDSLSHAGRLSVALNWGNAGNRQRLMDGRKWNDQQVEAILRTLTKADWDFVQGVWDYIDSFWPEIVGMSKRVEGVEPSKVDAAPVVTQFGTYRGGYYPAKYSKTKGGQPLYLDAKEQADRAFAGATMRSQTKHGFRKERATKVTMPIRLDLGIIFEHVNEVIHDVTHFETIMDVQRILKDKRVRDSMVDHYGPQVFRQLETALQDIAAGEVGAQNVMEQVFNHLRAGVSIAAMGWNVTTAMMQPLGFSQSAVRIGPKWLARGIRRLISSPTEMNQVSEWVDSKSDFMRLRAKTQMREINEIRNTVKGGASKLQDSYFWMISRMQRVVDLPTWIGAYERYMDEGFDDMKAVAMADQAVIDAQGSGMTKDLSAVQRGSPAFKLFTNFYSYFNTTYNMAARSTKQTDFTRPKEVGVWLADMLMLFTVPAVLGTLMREAIAGLKGEDDDEPLWQKMMREQATYLTGTMVGLREAGSAAFGAFGYEGPAGTRFFSQIGKLGKQAAQGEPDEAFWKALNQTAGIVFHYPAGMIQKTTTGFDYMVSEEELNPMPLIFGAPKE